MTEKKPDFTHTGYLTYQIDFYGNNAKIQILGQQTYYDKIAIHHIVKEDMNLLIEELKKNKKKVNKHFVQLDSQRAKSARYIIEKFIHQFLGVALHLQKNGITAEEERENVSDIPDHLQNNPATPEESFKATEQPGGETVKHQEGEL